MCPIKAIFMSNQDVHNYNTRHHNLLHVPVARTELVYKTFKYRGVHIWNEILLHVNVNVSFVSFKKLLYQHIFNNHLPIRYRTYNTQLIYCRIVSQI